MIPVPLLFVNQNVLLNCVCILHSFHRHNIFLHVDGIPEAHAPWSDFVPGNIPDGAPGVPCIPSHVDCRISSGHGHGSDAPGIGNAPDQRSDRSSYFQCRAVYLEGM